MASSAQLAIKLSTEGEQQVTRAMQSVAASIGKVGTAATAPVKALGNVASAIGDVGKMAAGFALGGALAAAPGMLLDMAKAAAADEQATARLSQTIKNLGGDFDAINADVAEAIKAGQKLAFSDDDVRDSYQFLASATGDHTEALKRQKAAMDLARGANIPLSQATKMLGKLNEENVEVFKKLGITLGDTATEADALAAVQAKFGGQAGAFADSTAGQFEQAQIAIAEIQESIGSALLPVLAKVGRALADNLPAIQETIGAIASTISTTLAPVLDAAGALLADVFAGLKPVLDPLLAVLPDIGTALGQVFAFMRDGSGDIEVFRGILNKLLGPAGAQGVIDVFTNLVGFFRTAVVPLWQDLAGAVQKALSGDVVGALQDGAAALATYGGKLVESLAEWARRFIEWVAPMIPPLLAELGKLLVQLGGWLGTVALPAIAAKLLEWGQAFVAWVAPQIMPMLAALGQLLLDLNVWAYTVALPAIVAQLAEWGKAFVGWVATEVIPKLPGALKTVQDTVTGFLLAAGPIVLTEAGKVGKSLYDGFMAELARLAPAVWEAVAGDGPDSLKSKIAAGLKAAIDNAIVAVKSWIDDLIAPFRAAWKTISDLLSKIRGGRKEAEGGGESGGGGASASRVGAATALGGPTVGTQTNYVTINAGAANADAVGRLLPPTLADLARTRVTAGAY